MSKDCQVPNYDLNDYFSKTSDSVLIIPVINEGNKIKKQLENIKIKKIQEIVDVVIVDGGSTDGSLERSFLEKQGVRALLVKDDGGRLSSQLRIAYYWALQEEYKTIITIDGNGKDDVSFIFNIQERLDQGYDYVKGSRYINGGKSINTPFDRMIASRFLHAPMISLASGFKFTDTTNGFRGYSSKFLKDERVNPFRDIFINYELLFYLSIRAAKLKFKVCEEPVSRMYPKNEVTPTKISGFSGRLRILKETLLAALGYFDPTNMQ